jgi:acetyltransferase
MLDELLYPNSVAVVGASNTQGKVGYAILKNLLDAGYQGKIYPVNPGSPEILGVPAYKDLKSLPQKLDLSVIAVPTAAVKDAVYNSVSAGAKAIIVITAGFKETGHEGAEMEKEIARHCAAMGVRLLGPNCLGFINTHHKMNVSFSRQTPLEGSMSVISQSGALCTAILDWAESRKLGLGKMFSIGNKADINEVDLLKVLQKDEKTKVIVAYLESIDDGNAFIRAAEDASYIKPVIVLKAGTTQAGVKAASSHTGSLAGADTAYGAAFKRSGIIRAKTFEALFDYAIAFDMQPLPKGRRTAVVTNAGGPGIMAADALENSGMIVAHLTEKTANELKTKLPSAASIANPIDVLGDADPQRYAMAITTAQEDDAVDAAIVILTPQSMTRPLETARAIAECAKSGSKPLLVSFMGGSQVIPGRIELLASHLPDYTSPERAVAALKAMCEYAEWRNRPPRMVTRFPVNHTRVRRVLSRHLKTGRMQVGEVQGKEILRAYGFHVPEGRLATTLDEALEISERVGFPVALKVSSPDIIHKSDIGGVKLNLTNRDMVRDAYELMMMRIPKHSPDARIEGVYVEKMAKKGLEVILGMNRDQQFGPMLMFGLGGIFVEVMKDVAFHLAPITSQEAMQMLTATRSYQLLKGARGQSGVNLDAIAEGLQRISQLATDFPEVAELDINPFMVGEAGQDAVVADTRITLREVKL